MRPFRLLTAKLEYDHDRFGPLPFSRRYWILLPCENYGYFPRLIAAFVAQKILFGHLPSEIEAGFRSRFCIYLPYVYRKFYGGAC